MTPTPTTTIRDWYHDAYPTDSAWEDVRPDATFIDLFDALDNYRCVYDAIGAYDSLVRERCFDALATMMGVDYGYVYDQWLMSA